MAGGPVCRCVQDLINGDRRLAASADVSVMRRKLRHEAQVVGRQMGLGRPHPRHCPTHAQQGAGLFEQSMELSRRALAQQARRQRVGPQHLLIDHVVAVLLYALGRPSMLQEPRCRVASVDRSGGRRLDLFTGESKPHRGQPPLVHV